MGDRTAAIMQHVQDLSNNLVRDRRWRLRKYKSCLEAKETLTSLVKAGVVEDREQGVLALRRCVEAGHIVHVANQHHFSDIYLFFRIVLKDAEDAANTIQTLPTLAEAKEREGSKHGPASVRCRGCTTHNRYLVLSSGVVYEYPNDHAPFPVLRLQLSLCVSGTVSYCGKMKPGQFGLSITPPLCESSGEQELQDQELHKDQESGGESKGQSKEEEKSSSLKTIVEMDHADKITFFFPTVQEQESWLGALVKAGLNFEESAPSTAEAKRASFIFEFKVEEPNNEMPIDLEELCREKVTVIVNVASF